MDFVAAWEAFPPDLKAFLLSVTANIATSWLPKKDRNGFTKDFNEAMHLGLVRFVALLGDAHYKSVPALLRTDELLEFLKKITRNGVNPGDDRHIKDLIYRNKVPIDRSTIEGLDMEKVLDAFLEGFQSAAANSGTLSGYLGRIDMKKIRMSVGRIDTRTESIDLRCHEMTMLLKEILWNVRTDTAESSDLAVLRSRYEKYLKSEHEYLSFKGFTEGRLISIPLKEIFTDLVFQEEKDADDSATVRDAERAEGEIRKEMAESGKPSDRHDIWKAGFAVVTGGPGTGKSTLFKRLSLDMIDGATSEKGPGGHTLLPVILPVISYADALKKSPESTRSIRDFVPRYFDIRGLGGLGPLFEHHWNNGTVLFMFDGLDEVSDESERRAMVDAVRHCVISDEGKGNRFLVTCRTASYRGMTRFDPVNGKPFSHFRVLPFGIDQVESFLLSWYQWYGREIGHTTFEPEKKAEKKRNDMVRVISADKNLGELASNPLMLTILALIEHEQGELPKDRVRLYERCLDMLTGRWEKLRSNHAIHKDNYSLGNREITSETAVEFLGPIAWQMLDEDSETIEYRDLKEELATCFNQRNRDKGLSRQQADDFIDLMKERSGILQEIAIGVYGFIMHRTFIEYLAARWLADFSDYRMMDLGERLFKDEWREVILLAAASLRKRDATNFLREIVQTPSDQCKNFILPGECICDIGRDGVRDDLYEDLIALLLSTIQENLPPAAKAGAGEVLGRLGDPREDLRHFVSIEEGTYKIPDVGSKHLLEFEIGKYPVTNSWYAEFIQAGGYGEGSPWWSPEGARWLSRVREMEPEYWHDMKWNCPNAPVVGICWWEANAFCSWLSLSRNDGWVYGLPTDGQWYAAAAGKADREFPWENENPKDGRPNTREYEIGRTTAVGFFPGSTPEEVSDLAGNVWEWTRSDYDSKKELDDFPFDEEVEELYDKNKYREAVELWIKKKNPSPALRGGSWDDNRDGARCAIRNFDLPLGSTTWDFVASGLKNNTLPSYTFTLCRAGRIRGNHSSFRK